MYQKDIKKEKLNENKDIIHFIVLTIKKTIEQNGVLDNNFNEEIYKNIINIKKYLIEKYKDTNNSIVNTIIHHIIKSFKRTLLKRIEINSILDKQQETLNYLNHKLKEDIKEFDINLDKTSSIKKEHNTSPISDNLNNGKKSLLKDLSGTAANSSCKRINYPKNVSYILKSWLLENINNPYPNEKEKNNLILKTGLFPNQINNWFINARRRILPKILQKKSNYKKIRCSESPCVTSYNI
ncbi:hypothetical protein NECID01_1004 [Nematocida sp. AWRm77]|nr:hypothetical protein NECID01_1004 [Nematocida sp. AWRm77]